MRRVFLALFLIIAAALVALYVFQGSLQQRFFGLTETVLEEGVSDVKEFTAKVVADNLNIPWEITFLPSGEMLVTERAGALVKIRGGKKRILIEGVEHVGEGGLLGLAVHQNFESNSWIYLYLTTRTISGLVNRVERYRLEGNQLFERTIIIDNIPGAQFHDGGRIAFGPDGFLYITTGDAGDADSAQEIGVLSGKILRLSEDGGIPAENPFENAVYSYGHRNPQGLAWDESGNLWATEHGRSGVRSGLDELNFIEKGKNYGWPVVEGDERREAMETPKVHSGSRETWAPAGALYHNNSIFFVGLRGESLYEAKIDSGEVVGLRTHFRGEFGRLRVIVQGPDGMFYIATSNTDGRGEARAGDDKIIRINPDIFG